jgi:hypothetical protein
MELGGFVMAQQHEPKKSQPRPDKLEPPSRQDVEAELPQAPAHEPLAEPTPVASRRGPGPRIERERE